MDRKLNGRRFVTRAMALAEGGTDAMIRGRKTMGWWTPVQAGVYRIGPDGDDWLQRLTAALLAAGPPAVVSHRSAYRLWGLEGIDSWVVEITVPYSNRPVPKGVIRHRTRRVLPATELQGLPVTVVERTLLDVAPLVHPLVLAKGVDSAVRMGLTDLAALAHTVHDQGGRGVRGARKLEAIVDSLSHSGPTGSPAEVELLVGMQRRGLPTPVTPWEISTPSGESYRVDFGWPDRRKGVEVDGLDAHSGAENLERDLIRQNRLLAAGVELRRFTARAIHRDLESVLTEIEAFLR